MTSATNYPFKTCINGHSLEGDNAFIYDKNHNQKCRMCVRESEKGKRRTTSRHRMID